MWYFMQMTLLVTIFMNLNVIVHCEITTASSSSGQDNLLELLHTEKVLIDSLRHYIETQKQSLDVLKWKTQEIQDMHDSVGENREKYLNNPINAVNILRRHTTDWRELKNEADNYLNTEELTESIIQQKPELTFPTEDDYDSALGNLLVIQDMFKLEPQRLSIGEVNGVKLGSEMSWSDCLEIGLKSFKKGYQTYAKFWMETALDKLPNSLHITISNTTDDQQMEKEEITATTPPIRDEYSIKARIEVLRALLNVEYKVGNLEKALEIANEMLELNPKQKNVIKAVQLIKDAKMKKPFGNKKTVESKRQKTPIKKTDEELMIEEICRETTNSQQQVHSAPMASVQQPQCILTANNLKWLMLQPLQVELLSLDPFIVIYHNVLSGTQSKVLKEFVTENDDDDNGSMQLTKIGMKKLHQFNEKLHYVTGHGRDALNANQWQVNRYNFENLMKVDTTAVKNVKDVKRQAGVLFNMQQPLLGGSVIFPQLQLSINLPESALLYWSTLNEFSLEDYRTKYHVCPVIGGTQLTATTYVRLL